MAQHPGIVYAKTADGYDLPVLDTTNPAFTFPSDPESLAALAEQYRTVEHEQAKVPVFIKRLFMKLAARRSELMRALVAPEHSYLGGLHTYIMKLGVSNLPERFNTSVDQRIVGSPHARYLRLRLQHCSQMLAEGIEPLLQRSPAAPLHLVNIGGGSAIDSINALLQLAQNQPSLLRRPIRINVWDLDTKGPTFGANALAALQSSDSQLSGLDITFSSKPYNWNNSGELKALLSTITEPDAIIAVSSEGALFEYGSDEAIVQNLATLHPRAKLVVGSITSNDPLRQDQIRTARFQLIPRGLDGFRPLVDRASYIIDRAEITPLSDQVRLRPR